MSDEEWQVIKPLMPWPAWLHGNGGRPEKYCRRRIMDAIRYVVDNGCKWRNLPADFRVPWRTVHAIFTRWWQDGDLYALHNDLRERVRLADGREPEPSAEIIDSQSLRAAETVAASSRGYDAANYLDRLVMRGQTGILLVGVVRDGKKGAIIAGRHRAPTWPRHHRIDHTYPYADPTVQKKALASAPSNRRPPRPPPAHRQSPHPS
ncbi:transposase [Nonomuraea guangzhouensis]|uniref:Transposase n=1 Tax=Nonomuraea guangzhouensis TaxID=1291555 RepID=A0ABW4H022_9ACTN|nr:transposase [Nonomuraea guangzhouensis]